MKYSRGYPNDSFAHPKSDSLKEALISATGNHLFVYDNDENLIRIVSLTGSMDYEWVDEEDEKRFGFYGAWAEMIRKQLKLGGKNERVWNYEIDREVET